MANQKVEATIPVAPVVALVAGILSLVMPWYWVRLETSNGRRAIVTVSGGADRRFQEKLAEEIIHHTAEMPGFPREVFQAEKRSKTVAVSPWNVSWTVGVRVPAWLVVVSAIVASVLRLLAHYPLGRSFSKLEWWLALISAIGFCPLLVSWLYTDCETSIGLLFGGYACLAPPLLRLFGGSHVQSRRRGDVRRIVVPSWNACPPEPADVPSTAGDTGAGTVSVTATTQ